MFNERQNLIDIPSLIRERLAAIQNESYKGLYLTGTEV